MKTYKSILVQMVFMLLLSHLSFSQEVEVNLGGNATSDAFVVKDSSGNVLLKMDGDKNFGINSEQPDGIEIKGNSMNTDGEDGNPIKIIGGSVSPYSPNNGGSVSILGGSGGQVGGSIILNSGGSGDADGGNVSIGTGGGPENGGSINISTAGGQSAGDININTGTSNRTGGAITLSTGTSNGGGNGITLSTGGSDGSDNEIKLLSSGRIKLKTHTAGDMPTHINLETGFNEFGHNNIELTVGDDGVEGDSRGIILSPNGGVVEVIGSGTYTGTWTQASDERYKNNIKPLPGILKKVNLLEPVEYEWNKEEFPENNFPDGNQIGLIAQEVERLFPEIVATNKDGYKSIDYSKISVLLIQTVKEQQSEINKMKSELEELKSMIMQEPNKFSSNDNQQEVN